ncbi:MAG: type II toxin-antitoxin system HicA family toxin [Verrucomicrobiae bacterium]|nr:type II toxin-antitoxin system HicA family toxin [Verrucomicrobiae bacterium]
MKRVELIQRLNEMGCIFIRHGGKHDWYQNPRTKMCQPVPRHRELKEILARSIIKKLSDAA